MEKLHDTGQVKQLGISNLYDVDQLTKLWNEVRIKPAVVQNRFNKDVNYNKPILEFCKIHNCFLQSFWTLSSNKDILSHHIMQDISTKRNKTPEEIFFRFLTQFGIVPLTGTSSKEHMEQDLFIFSFKLSPQEMSQIEALLELSPKNAEEN